MHTELFKLKCYNGDDIILNIHKAYHITVGLVEESLISDPCAGSHESREGKGEGQRGKGIIFTPAKHNPLQHLGTKSNL